MKFSNGHWLLKERCECFDAKQVYDTKIEPGKVTLLVPTIFIRQRGDTLGGINLTVVITSPMPEVLRVQTWHHMGAKKKTPEFELHTDAVSPLTAEETEDMVIVRSGSLTLEITKNPWSMTYKRNGEVITKSGVKGLALMKTDWRGHYYDTADDTDTYMRAQLGLGVGELVYGLGERFTAFAKNGQSIDIWNEDGGTSTELSYKNIPFYITNKGYGVFVNHPERVSFEIGSEIVTKAGFSVEGGYLDYFFINGPTMKETLTRYTDLTGKPSLPAPWTFGLWLSTSFTTNYDEATVMSFVDGMFERGIPLRVFHFDCFWMKEFHWSDFLWDDRVFPDPEGLLARLKAKGLNICVWINSYIGQESALFAEGVEHGYFVKRKNGDVWQWDMWQPGMALVDFTNPEACRWFQSKLEKLLDMGVDCFKTDFGERIPTDVVYYDGSDPKKMHNYYTYLYNKTVYELLERKRGKGEAVLFARSATVGGQKFPVHWGGDCWSDYESMEESLRGGLSLTSSGFGYWSHDIGGFEHTSTPDVYKRWAAFGLLSSHSRLHGSSSYRVPWTYDEEAVDVVRTFTLLKASLMPYLYRNAIETSKTGIPMMRSMVLEFTSDRNCAYLDKQYLFGDSLLVAPIFNDRSQAEYYLPKGHWTNYFTNEEKCGGDWYTEYCPYLQIPLFVKENSILAVNDDAKTADYDYADGVTLKAYALLDSIAAETTVYNQKAEAELTVSIIKETSADGASFRIRLNDTVAHRSKPYHILLVNEHVTTVSAGTLTQTEAGSLIEINGSCELSAR
ncbi:MAG: alpha-xylosidase [Lachnospiraceae bacterium]